MSAKVEATTDNGSSRRAATPARQIVPAQISGPPGSERPPAGLFVAVATLAFVLLLAGGFVTVKALAQEWAPLGMLVASPQDPVQCWNGNTYDDPIDCPQPTGSRGLSWVFPTSQAFSECWLDDPRGLGELESVQCQWGDLNVGGGQKTYVNFSRWNSAAQARAYLESNMPDPQTSEATDTIGWMSEHPLGANTPGYALAYRKQPYSFFILGPNDNLEEAMKRLTPRPQSEVAMHGVPVETND